MNRVLQDTVILVTGGSSGVGRSSAMVMAREGGAIVVADNDVAGGKATVDAIRRAGGEATFVEADVCRERDVAATLQRLIARYGRLDGAFNNADVLKGTFTAAACIASKHGVVGLTRVAALEYAAQGLRINAICPGIVDDTVMSEAIFGGDAQREAQVKALYPAGRVGTLDEVAHTVAWFFTDASSFITGHALPIDGGLLAQ